MQDIVTPLRLRHTKETVAMWLLNIVLILVAGKINETNVFLVEPYCELISVKSKQLSPTLLIDLMSHSDNARPK
jgi:hypothetical protein